MRPQLQLLHRSRTAQAAPDGCTAKEVDFSDVDLTGAVFSGTDFMDSRFVNCDLTKADFNDAVNYAIDVKQNWLKKTKFALPEAVSLLKGLDIVLRE